MTQGYGMLMSRCPCDYVQNEWEVGSRHGWVWKFYRISGPLKIELFACIESHAKTTSTAIKHFSVTPSQVNGKLESQAINFHLYIGSVVLNKSSGEPLEGLCARLMIPH